MGILSSIILGLLVGALAKWIMPGKDPGGLFITMVLGMAGAMIGGFIGTQLGIGDVTGFNLVSIGLATLGAIILLIIYRLITR
ncbi:MAG: GlsB/YeaQ/YmgE family stress response membrane protein [Gammaproteobacteria bacterium]|nr:GlsB/YeaQ/YmgE family stress response membrane protein [Gammaproteobacteria bacterium]